MINKYEAHLREEKCMAERSVRDYMMVAREISGKFDVTQGLTYKQINDSVADLKARLKWSQGTVYKYSICVRHFFKWLQREGYRQDNPYAFTEWRKPRPGTPKFLTQEQFDALTEDPLLSAQELTFLWLLWDTGARIGEIAQLKQSNIDLIKKTVTIPYEISKGHYSHRVIPIGDRCADLLLTQFAKLQKAKLTDCVFISNGRTPMTKSGLQKKVAAIGMRKSLFRDEIRLSSKMFRHSCVIRWLKQKVPALVISKWMGHSDPKMTLRYLNMIAEDCREVYDQYCAPVIQSAHPMT